MLGQGLGFDEVCTTNQARTDKQIVCHTGLDGEMLAEKLGFIKIMKTKCFKLVI